MQELLALAATADDSHVFYIDIYESADHRPGSRMSPAAGRPPVPDGSGFPNPFDDLPPLPVRLASHADRFFFLAASRPTDLAAPTSRGRRTPVQAAARRMVVMDPWPSRSPVPGAGGGWRMRGL